MLECVIAGQFYDNRPTVRLNGWITPIEDDVTVHPYNPAVRDLETTLAHLGRVLDISGDSLTCVAIRILTNATENAAGKIARCLDTRSVQRQAIISFAEILATGLDDAQAQLNRIMELSRDREAKR